nr:Tim44-like domain containing protein [Ipomoea batatas]
MIAVPEKRAPKKTVSINENVEEINSGKKLKRRKKSKEKLLSSMEEEEQAEPPKRLKSILKVESTTPRALHTPTRQRSLPHFERLFPYCRWTGTPKLFHIHHYFSNFLLIRPSGERHHLTMTKLGTLIGKVNDIMCRSSPVEKINKEVRHMVRDVIEIRIPLTIDFKHSNSGSVTSDEGGLVIESFVSISVLHPLPLDFWNQSSSSSTKT